MESFYFILDDCQTSLCGQKNQISRELLSSKYVNNMTILFLYAY
jgi:hypothetical protein